tara:strand:+ start:2865 stop:3113 length:249 start_codon:yes stop_codon:yes gene_type:complete
MKKSQLHKLIKEEVQKVIKEGEEDILHRIYNDKGYASGQILKPLVRELINNLGVDGAKKFIEKSLIDVEPQYDMDSDDPFGR